MRLRVPLLACTCLIASSAWAGPPFLTDDPVPVPEDHWEVYGFSSGTHARDDNSGTLFGIDANYGVTSDMHLHLLVTSAFDHPMGDRRHAGLGDVEVGMKYRVFNPGDDKRLPQVAIYPAIDFPTGSADKGLGSGSTHAFLPVWLQWEVGEWTTYGGAGYWINPGAGNRDYWFFGWQLQRQLTPNLAVGCEIVHTTADAAGAKDSSGMNLGGMYDLSENYHLLFSVGRGIRNVSATDELQYYIGVQWTR